MSAGTIALTNNSATVSGTGTVFTTDLKANDFIVVIVGGVTYTLGVKATASATSLTLITPYGGPTATGNAWTAVPNATLVGITAQVAADVAKAIRGLNLDKANWQQVFSGTGNITVTLPDGSTYPGPSWKYLSDNMATKVSGAVPILQGGTGGTTDAAARTALKVPALTSNTFTDVQTMPGIEIKGAATPFIDFHFQNDPSDYTGRIAMFEAGYIGILGVPLDAMNNIRCRRGASGAVSSNSYNFYWNDTSLEAWIQQTRVGNVQMQSTSDIQLKNLKEYVTDSVSALQEVMMWRPATFNYKKRGVLPESEEMLGFIANDLIVASPECVKGEGLKDGWDEENPTDPYYLDETAMIAKLTGAIQAQQNQIEDLQKQIAAFVGSSEPTI
ncbi:tail fiber domain-containing protein [Rahnella inusitata]|uniref:tail fiber domain-containing protein n=1 Tax=Rahnella inusitata TaxID=58169 RepID=UPI0039B107F5